MVDKKIDPKLEKMMKKVNKVADKKADLTPQDTLKVEAKAKIRDKRISSYLTDKEKKEFIALIGRKSESDALRDFILNFIKENKK
jgi:hypothetical protein